MERFLKCNFRTRNTLVVCIMSVAAFSPEIKLECGVRFQDRNRVARGSPRSFINNLFSTRAIDEPDRDAHVPRHATLSFEPIIEAKSVITGESHPKLVPSSRPFLPSFLAQRNRRCSSCFHRRLSREPFSLVIVPRSGEISFRDLVYLALHRTGFHLGGEKRKSGGGGGCGK